MNDKQKKISKERRKLFEKLEKDLFKRVTALQGQFLSDVTSDIIDLDIGPDGKIKSTFKNEVVRRDVLKRYRKFAATQLTKTAKWLVSQIDKLFKLHAKYFSPNAKFNKEVEKKVKARILNRLGWNAAKKKMIKDGFLDSVINSEAVGARIAKEISKGLGTSTLKEMRGRISKLLSKKGGSGLLEQHFRTFTNDLFSQYDREIAGEFAKELDIKYRIFAGTAKNNTRCFCLQRINRIYEDEFIQTWNALDWDGKNGDVDTDLGGFNCRHYWDYITEEAAKLLAKSLGIEINTYNDVNCVLKK